MKYLPLAVSACLLASAPAIADDPQERPQWEASERDERVREGRALLARERPDSLAALARHGGFGGPFSRLLAQEMLGDSPAHVAEARSKMSIIEVAPGLWHLVFPWVNVALIETRDSLVLFDAGYTSMGPVLAEVIPTLSDKPLSHIVVSHTHTDHAYGVPALLERWPDAKVIASTSWPQAAEDYARLGASIARYNNQPVALQPSNASELPTADILIGPVTEMEIGGELFRFHHAPAETEEQIWMEMPGRRAIFTADYYQGFLPNAGNGKRMQRYIEEWADALRKMAAAQPLHLVPMHGEYLSDPAVINERLTTTAEALEFITDQVVDGLNRGERKDVIAANLEWPQRFADNPVLDPQYNRPQDIARMVAKRWTGWWDDIPSHFPPMTFEEEAREAVRLAGGIEQIDSRARELLPVQPRLAARLADWARYGEPDNPVALQLAIDVYLARLADPDTPLQEGTVYLDAAAEARSLLEALKQETTNEVKP